MKHILISLFAILLLFPVQSQAQNADQTFATARITDIQEIIEPDTSLTQQITFTILNGDEKETSHTVDHTIDTELQGHLIYKPNQTILITHFLESTDPIGNVLPEKYYIVEPYRIPALAWTAAIFFGIVILLGRKKGLASIFGLIITIAVITLFIVPQIIAGANPLFIMILGGILIIFASIYIAHGFNAQTTIALISIIISFGCAALFAHIAIITSSLFGFGSETAFFLQQDLPPGFDFRGLLLGGILLGALGVLDDITTGQAAAVHEIHKANTKLTKKELYQRGLSVGREHIASLVNTLVLAYAGASFPIFLFIYLYDYQPLWVILNNELFAEEIIRTLIGSTALVLAVPITTIIAATYFAKKNKT